MSAHRILGAEVGPSGRLGCSPIKAVRELEFRIVSVQSPIRRETVDGELSPVREGPGWTGRWCICCSTVAYLK